MSNTSLDKIDEIKAIISELVGHLAESSRISAKLESNQDEERIIFNITVEEADQPSILIGQRGNNLKALQHLARTLVRSKLNEDIEFSVDINDYFKGRQEFLTHLANKTAREVSLSGRAVALEPMPSFERRLIHLTLANHPNITTESSGDYDQRKVVIKPKRDEQKSIRG